ncbi:DHH family phosphoesterase [Serpentinicella sp. ANB-PHB4]|uniref:DHH family phosphoesterase n=1 Tax=Serpentinicella sp. ANB-PHB4 TaxID=3074076 RepID=UPI00285FC4C4|nr:DHH family phosphoesterase [Serpentinicella sp. ANB-PHB4]MDR5658880.1 DHH family phosphoesterase [Serpentinicella sp. ANB-PHB4]
MQNRKIFKMLIPDTRIYLIITTLLTGIIAYYNPMISIGGIFLLAYLIYYNLKITNIRREEWTRYIEDLSSDIDSATKQAILNLPMPLTIVEIDGTITWYNPKFLEVVQINDLLEKNIEKIVQNFNLRKIIRQKETETIIINDRCFRVLHNIIKLPKEHSSSYIIMLYWVETTEYEALKSKYEQEKVAVASIHIDNYDEVMQNTEEAFQPLVIAEIDHRINLWVNKYEGVIRKHAKDKFLVIFESASLDKLENKKIDILDEIRDINMGNKIPITLSIGIGAQGENLLQTFELSNTARDLALGRGGDQAAVKRKEKISFYGGKTKAVEKSTKVRARVISHALKQLIEQSENVFIMGHKYPDLDALGASLGIYRAARNREREAFIVLNNSNPTIDCLFDRIKNEEAYLQNIIKEEEAMQKIGPASLLVVVDTHRPSFTEAPGLLEKTNKVVIIDHHRRGTEYIENTVLNYHETYASSTSELVTELLYYMDEKININPVEAEGLMAGIAVDTKNFTFKTGVRTFEAASMLRRAGADTTSVKQLFKDDLETVKLRAEVVKNAEIIRDTIAISTFKNDIDHAQLISAQAADELIGIRGVDASFVLGVKGENIVLSGRSMGEINVQVILEKLGGGGHMTVAGAQIKDISLTDARLKLQEVIEAYFEEGEEI